MDLQEQANEAGQQCFFFPTRFFPLGGPLPDEHALSVRYSLLTAENSPLGDARPNDVFPLPNPIGVNTQRILSGVPPGLLNSRFAMAIKLLSCATIHTSVNSRTKITPRIKELSINQRLHQIRHCPELWANLINYAYEGSDHNTFIHGPAIAIARDQFSAIGRLHGATTVSAYQTPTIVNGEPAIQDVIRSQLLNYADSMLQVSHHIFHIITTWAI